MDRRRFLKGAGVFMSLPLLESFAAATKKAAPVRLIYLGFIFGVTKSNQWFPTTLGRNFELTNGLKPLARHRNDLTIFSNMGNPAARDSHYSCTTLYTGANLKRTAGRAFHNSISCDQIAAKYLGSQTRYSSIQIGCSEQGTGPGLSLAWDELGKPVPGIKDPVELFNQLFGDGKKSLAQRRHLLSKRKSVLDAVRYETRALQKAVTTTDKDKLEEYFQTIRQIEVSLQKETSWLKIPKLQAPFDKPKNGLRGKEYIKTMYDLMVTALQTDASRVISFMQPVKTLIDELDISYTSHQLSHHDNRPDALRPSAAKDAVNSELLSYLLDKLKSVKDLDGKSLFENSIVTYASGVRYGHMLKDVPTIISGGGGGKLKHKGYIKVKEGENRLSNLWLTTLNAAGVPAKSFSDSNALVDEVLT